MNDMQSTQTLAYGLISTELHRASERRAAERQRHEIAKALRLPGSVISIRQRLGDAMIRVGANIAGETVPPRPAAPDIRPTTNVAWSGR